MTYVKAGTVGQQERFHLRYVPSAQVSDLGDLSTLSEPEVVDCLIKEHAKLRGETGQDVWQG